MAVCLSQTKKSETLEHFFKKWWAVTCKITCMVFQTVVSGRCSYSFWREMAVFHHWLHYKVTLLGGIKRLGHHAGGISTAGNALHMKNVNDLIHKRKKMNTQRTQLYWWMQMYMQKYEQFDVAEAKKNGIEISRGNNLKRTVISREYYYNLMPSLELLTMW